MHDSAVHSREKLLAGPARAPYGCQMAGDPQIELRVSRLENDRTSIYDLLSEIAANQQEHTRRLDGVDSRFDGVDQRFDGVDQRFDGVDQRFDSIDATLIEIVRRLPEPS